jgi:phytoene synthase
MTQLILQSRTVLASRARSFRWAAAFLPARCHDDAAVLYAFCRAVDDAADESASLTEAAEALRNIERTLDGDGDASTVVGTLRDGLLRDPLCMRVAKDLLDGAWSDLSRVRIANDAELLQYGYRVAGTVGVLMCRVLGVEARAALPHAIDLGIAMQLTNICRDVLEDAAIDRVYLPEDRLRAAGTSQQAVLDGTAPGEAIAQVVRELLDLAERYYESANAGLRYIPPRPRLAIVVASKLYRSIGRRLLRRGANPLNGRVVVPWWEKVTRVFQALAAWPMLTWQPRYLRPHAHELHACLPGPSHASPR